MKSAGQRTTDVADLVSRLTVTDIRCSTFSAGLSGEVVPPPARILVKIADEITYAVTEEFLGGRYDAKAVMQDSTGNDIARVQVTFLLEHTLAPGQAPTSDAISSYLNGEGLFTVYPYLRQAIQDGFDRIGLGTLVLGILATGQVAPVSLDISLTDDAKPA